MQSIGIGLLDIHTPLNQQLTDLVVAVLCGDHQGSDAVLIGGGDVDPVANQEATDIDMPSLSSDLELIASSERERKGNGRRKESDSASQKGKDRREGRMGANGRE
jgi:hypothetical protein